ncbi:MAG: methyltransferase [Gammaproteobacteria bacterium]
MAKSFPVPTSMPNSSSLFSTLSNLLLEHQRYWRPVAFRERQLPWMDQHPGLVQRLLALSPEQIENLGTDNVALTHFMSPDLPVAVTLAQLCAVPVLPQRDIAPPDPRFYAGIPGRKWEQVDRFVRALPVADLPVLEWCAGKSHLGFWLQQCQQQPVTALEWDAALVQQANARAHHDQVALHSFAVDVLGPTAQAFIKPAQQAVALHACGDLHEHLLQLCVAERVQQVYVAPCCYHKRVDDIYRPLSQHGRANDLQLNKRELHTAVMETVTAGATVRRQRIRLQIMRLGFDCLQRDIRGVDTFLPLPSLPARWARASFADFCQHCAALKQIDLPATIDESHYLQQGEYWFWRISALDLVRSLFRRPLEIWLALDRALLLQEQGYAVQLGTFCATHVTRNLLIQGKIV